MSEFYRIIDWKFYPESVNQLTENTYYFTAAPFDLNDPGAADREIGNYVVDFVGRRYKVIGSSATTLTVEDEYSTGKGPQTDQVARCYQSVAEGDAEYVGSVDYSVLDLSAQWKINGADKELLWQKIASLLNTYLTNALFNTETDELVLTRNNEQPEIKVTIPIYSKITESIEALETDIPNAVTEVSTSVSNGIIDNFKETFLIDNTAETSVTQYSTWEVIDLNERCGEFKATVMVRDKSTDTVYSLQNILGFDHTDESNPVSKDNTTITDGTLSMAVSIDAATKNFKVVISSLPGNPSRIHFCFERCVAASAGLTASGNFYLTATANNSAAGVLTASANMALSATANLKSLGNILASGNMVLSATATATAVGELLATANMALTGSGSIEDTIEIEDVSYGYLYNWYAATDARNIANTGWHVPTVAEFTTLVNFLLNGDTDYSVAANALKETGTTYWNTANGNNNSGFNGRGCGYRNYLGVFTNLKYSSWNHSSDSYAAWQSYGLVFNDIHGSSTVLKFLADNVANVKRLGTNLRLIKDSTTLSNGETGTYTGNDGKVYSTICIGTQEFVANSLKETKYRDGTAIPEVTDASTWAGLTTGARCVYDNDENNA